MSDISISQATSDVEVMQKGVAQAINESENNFQAAGALIGAAAGAIGGFVVAGAAATAVGAVNPVAGTVAAVGVLPAAYASTGVGAVAGQKIAKAVDEITDRIADKIVEWVDNL